MRLAVVCVEPAMSPGFVFGAGKEREHGGGYLQICSGLGEFTLSWWPALP